MKELPLWPFLAFRTIIESASCTESMSDWGTNPPPATNLILLNHQGQRVFRWPFFLFIPCSTVQNSPNFVSNSAFVCRDCERVAHRGLRFGMSQPVQPDCHRSTDLIQ